LAEGALGALAAGSFLASGALRLAGGFLAAAAPRARAGRVSLRHTRVPLAGPHRRLHCGRHEAGVRGWKQGDGGRTARGAGACRSAVLLRHPGDHLFPRRSRNTPAGHPQRQRWCAPGLGVALGGPTCGTLVAAFAAGLGLAALGFAAAFSAFGMAGLAAALGALGLGSPAAAPCTALGHPGTEQPTALARQALSAAARSALA